MSKTIKLKITSGGTLAFAHPLAEVGSKHLTYAITKVPTTISMEDCALQANKVCFVHSLGDESAYTYDWAELAGKPQGAVINRYPRA
jgi:hypothetical protein